MADPGAFSLPVAASRLLLRHLMNLKFDSQAYMDAPKTAGLLEQKHASLDLFGECTEGRELIEAAPKLRAWLERMLARPSFAATQPPEVLREAA